MATIEDIVNVTISRQTKAVQRAAFDVMLFLGRNKFWSERYRSFSNLADMVSAGVPTNSAEYLGAAAYFGQDGSPNEIAIGRKDPTKVILSFVAANTATYSVYVGANATTPLIATFTSDGSATANEIAVGLRADIEAQSMSAAIVSTVVGDTIEITEVASNVAIVRQWTDNIAVTYEDSESFATALTAVSNENDSWYSVATYSHLQADIEAVALYLQTLKKLYGYSTGNADDITSTATNVMGVLNGAGYTRSFGAYDSEAGIDDDPASTSVTYAECAWFGRMLPLAPGSATWMFKSLTGISPDGLTNTQANYVLAKEGNTYETIGGQAITREGTVASGEYIDIIRGLDWLESRIEERIYSRLVNLAKIPFTDAGYQVIGAEVTAQLLEAQDAGVIAQDSVDSDGNIIKGFTVSIPKVSTISTNDKIARIATGISFIGKLAGAIHTLTIEGNVTV